jgi:hypothetical protein
MSSPPQRHSSKKRTRDGTPVAARETARGVVVGAWMALLASGGCAPPTEAAEPARALPPYDRPAAELFDDAVEPSAVGYTLESTPSSKRPHLRDRTLAADAVVRARVVTVTSDSRDAAGALQVGLRTIETLSGANPPNSFTLLIKNTNPSAGVVRDVESRIAGMTFVAFLREFAPAPGPEEANGPGAAQLHFHVAPDSKDEVDAVREAALLGEFH